MSFARASIPQVGTRLRAWLAGVWQRTRRLTVFSNPEDLSPEQRASPNFYFWVRVFLWEVRSFVQRIRFARERFSAPRCGVMDFLCQSCAAGGDRYCYKNVSRYMLHIAKLRSAYPWIGWADMLLFDQTWSVALDEACCSLDNARTLLKSQVSKGMTCDGNITRQDKL
jgi:hypothetical protein